MKTFDLTKAVMERVLRYEKKRSLAWLGYLGAVIGSCVLLATAALWRGWQKILERQIFDSLSLFTQDRDTIKEFWHDTMLTVWEELPKRNLSLGFLVVTLLVVILFLTRHRRQSTMKKLRQINQLTSRM